MTLVARRREQFRVFLAIFLFAQLSPKRGLLVYKNSLVGSLRTTFVLGTTCMRQHCSFAFTVDNDEVIFKGKFVNPATHSDLLVGGKATLRTPFCVLFSDKECKRYSTTQDNKAVKLSHKIDLIAAIIAHVSIHDMLGLDSLAPLPQVQASFKENQNCASG